MGFLWNPSTLDAGIDGYIEIRDPNTGEARNLIIAVQSKATATLGVGEEISFICKERDIEYWLQGNLPVIVVHVILDRKEAYWVSVKDYFKQSERRSARKIVFDPQKSKLQKGSATELLALARPSDSGLYFSPPPVHESLITNLLPVTFPSKIHFAETSFRWYGALRNELKQKTEKYYNDFILAGKMILTFHDLREAPWKDVCDIGTAETFDTSEWAQSQDINRRNEFATLLGKCLRQLCYARDCAYSDMQECFYINGARTLKPKRHAFKGLKRNTSHTVFQGYSPDPVSGNFQYYKHAAFQSRFLPIGDAWYLEVSPTYYYSSDGKTSYRNYQALLKGIKRQEHNLSVLMNVIMWRDILATTGLLTDSYPFLNVGDPIRFNLDVGIDDEAWLGKASPDEDEIIKSALEEASLLP
jgi:hypothetical protein